MGMCGVCASVCGCVRVCGGVRECAGVCGGVRECVHGCARVCAGVGGSAWVCMGVRGCARVCTGVRGYGMYFQNFFWRIESLHQRTLICFLYEFLLHKIASKAQIAAKLRFFNFFQFFSII